MHVFIKANTLFDIDSIRMHVCVCVWRVMGEYVYRYNCRAGELHRTRFVIWTKAAVCVRSSELLKLRGIIIILLSIREKNDKKKESENCK